MKMKKKLTPGVDFPSRKSKEGESAERGKAIKRKALNRAKDKESLESIKEYCYDNDRV